MNRTTALIIALAILLAHALAIHKSANGQIAQPFDMAFVAYRVGRNVVQAGSFAWDPMHGPAESYPSLLWAVVALVAERLYSSVSWLCQLTGLLSALVCVLVVARFSPERLAGVIAPLLFVFSGAVASSALSGIETATLTLLLTFSFLAYERGWRMALAGALTLACLTRPEALLFTATLLAIDLARRTFALRRPNSTARPSMLAAFAAPLAVALASGLWRQVASGQFLSNWSHALLTPRNAVVREGLAYLGDFAITSAGPALFVFPLWYLLRGALRGAGARACVLTLTWFAGVALTGGGSLPFFEALTPTLAILFVAVQEAMQIALDSRRRGLPQLTWALFLLGLASSTLVSKFPGDLGPLPLEAWHRRWMTPHTQPRFGYEQQLGRVGLAEEIRATERLREIGIFLREHLDPSHSVLTPWPGAIGYLSRMRVIDALGRTTPTPGERTRSWSGSPRTDVLRVLSLHPDYIVPTITFGDEAPSAQSIAAEWAKSLDVQTAQHGRRNSAIRAELGAYELITVPIVGQYSRPGVFPRNRFYLMRRGELGLAPNLALELEQRAFSVEVAHRSHEQLVDLRVQLIDRAGAAWSLRPTGEFVRRADVLARTTVLLHPTGERRITLVRAHIPAHIDAVELRAVLRNPGASGESLFSSACEELIVQLGD